MRPFPRRNAQRGAALLVLVAIAVLTFAYVLTSRLHSPAGATVVKREHNARVLSQAKQALIGWMVLNAGQTDNNPGRLPCPEGANSIGSAFEGTAAPTITPSTPTCPRVGRLPWRTLGLDNLVDAAAEPLWYVVSPGWALQNSSSLLTINSDSRGNMAVDGQAAPNDVVALIIAPGPAMNVAAATGCTARAQVRAAPAAAMDPADYLECFDATTPAFSTTGPPTSFNDQVVAIYTSDLVPLLEAVIANRIQREIAPALKSVYGSAQWGTSATNPIFPFAAPWANPGASNYRGADGRYRGLLPVNCSETGCASDARYAPTFVSWNTGIAPTVSISGEIAGSGSCTFATSTTVECTGSYLATGTVTLRIRNLRANNVAMSLRQLEPSRLTIRSGLVTCGSPTPGTAASAVLQTNGSADLTLEGQAPGLTGLTLNFCMSADLGVLGDHPLADRNDTTVGWFVRNEWHKQVYYAVAPESTADGLPSYGCDSTDCLRFNDPSVRNIRALLVFSGRSLATPPMSRPNSTLSDYLEGQNCDFNGTDCDPQTLFEQRVVRFTKPPVLAPSVRWNDRVVLVDWIPPNPTFPLPVVP